VSLLGQSVELPAGATLPVNNVAAGEVAVAVRYADGTAENRIVRVEANRSASVSFDYKPTLAAPPAQATTSSLPRTLDAGQSWTSPTGIKLMAVAAGSFQMGSPSGGESDERPVRQVTLSGFWLGATELTQGQWQAVMGSNPSDTSRSIGASNPVNNVSWYNILVFCNRLSIKEGLTPVYAISGSTDPARWGAVPTSGNSTWNAVTANWKATGYRLPTEAEWEYAAKGGQAGARQNVAYAGSNNADEVAWYDANSGNKLQTVGLKKANALGVFDMSGNVWEWVWDWYGKYTSSAQSDPMGPASGTDRVYRGGSWVYGETYLRSAFRNYTDPDFRHGSLGFRLARPPVR
jgi:formylglycine-generating enzyme